MRALHRGSVVALVALVACAGDRASSTAEHTAAEVTGGSGSSAGDAGGEGGSGRDAGPRADAAGEGGGGSGSDAGGEGGGSGDGSDAGNDAGSGSDAGDAGNGSGGGSDAAGDGGNGSGGGSDAAGDGNGSGGSDAGGDGGGGDAGGDGSMDAGTSPMPDAPPDAPRPKPRVVKCQGELTTTATLRGTSGQHHVSASNNHVTDYTFRTDRIEFCDRNWCQDNDPVGVYFTHHGGTGDVTWKTTCKPSGVPDRPCVAEITDHDPRTTAKFEDHNGDAQHWHWLSPFGLHWEYNHTCAFSGEIPNIQVQKYCNTSVVVNDNARGDHIAYGILYSANHSSSIPVGVSIGIVAGPVFGAASYTPTHGTGTYGASRGYETAMGCKKVGERELETMIVEFWEPTVIETKKYSAEASNENGTFADPVLSSN